MTKKSLQDLKNKTVPIFRRYGVKKAGVFGSFARGEAKRESDIDFYVIYGPKTTLFTIGGINYDLETTLKRRVDLADGGMLRPEFKPSILKDLRIFYEKK